MNTITKHTILTIFIFSAILSGQRFYFNNEPLDNPEYDNIKINYNIDDDIEINHPIDLSKDPCYISITDESNIFEDIEDELIIKKYTDLSKIPCFK